MSFDLQELEDRIAKRLPHWWARTKNAGVTSAYAGFAAATMWPIIEEAQRGNLVGAGMLIGSLSSGVWGSLMAAQRTRGVRRATFNRA
jgi:hypothetical protein